MSNELLPNQTLGVISQGGGTGAGGDIKAMPPASIGLAPGANPDPNGAGAGASPEGTGTGAGGDI